MIAVFGAAAARGQEVDARGGEARAAPYRGMYVKELNVEARRSPPGTGWSFDLRAPTAARFVQLDFEIVQPAPFDYRLRIFSYGEVKEDLQSAALAARPRYLTGLLPGGDLTIFLSTDADWSAVPLRLKSAMWPDVPDAAVALESAATSWRTEDDVDADEPISAYLGSVAMLHVGPLGINCSAALVGEALLLTNRHCVEYSLAFGGASEASWRPCDDIVAEFPPFDAQSRGPQASCASLFYGEDEPDLALIELVDAAEDGVRLRDRKPLAIGMSAVGNVSILHFPVGLPLRIDTACRIVRKRSAQLDHSCYTLSGSSGAPLIGEDGKLAGVHYWGPFPLDWTNEQTEAYIRLHGAAYNAALDAPVVKQFIDHAREEMP